MTDLCCLSCPSIAVRDGDSGRGRCVVASSKIAVGTVVIQNRCTAHMLLTSLWGERCLNCYSTKKVGDGAAPLSTCTKCKKASYCCRECQVADWPQHKLECKQIEKLWGKVHEDLLCEVFILLRMNNVEKMMDDKCKLVEHVTCCGRAHYNDMHTDIPDFGAFPDEVSDLVITLAARISGRNIEELRAWLWRFRQNNFGVTDDLMHCLGIGVYPATALLNHSCAPNCVLRYNLSTTGHVVDIVAIRDIAAGEELTHSYVDCTLPYEMRHTRLYQTYDFDCMCKLCVAKDVDSALSQSLKAAIAQYVKQDPQLGNALLLKDTIEFWKAENNFDPTQECCSLEYFQSEVIMNERLWNDDVMNRLIQQIDQDMVNAEDEESLASCVKRLKSVVEKFELYYGPFHLNMHKIRGKLLTAYLMQGDHIHAYKVCSQLVNYLNLTLLNMGVHPLLGVQLYTLADLSTSLDDKVISTDLYNWCKEVLTITHGSEAVLVQSLSHNNAEQTTA